LRLLWLWSPVSMGLQWTYLYCNRCHSCGSLNMILYCTHQHHLSLFKEYFFLHSCSCRRGFRWPVQVHPDVLVCERTAGENHGNFSLTLVKFLLKLRGFPGARRPNLCLSMSALGRHSSKLSLYLILLCSFLFTIS
jgi:hypothetical protein